MRRKRPIYANTYRRRRWVLFGLAVAIVVLALGGAWWYFAHRNPRPNATRYPVLGVRLDQTDGDQDFAALHKAGVSFAYLKATEGASYFDDDFAFNYQHAAGSGVALGVYHFLSFDSTPAKQAAQFETNVGNDIGTLPIGIEVGYYSDYVDSPPPASKVRRQLTQLIALLAAKYQRPVVIMGTPRVLAVVARVSPASPRWVIAAKPTKTATYWEYATAKLPQGPAAEYRAVVFTGTRAAFAQQSNKTVR